MDGRYVVDPDEVDSRCVCKQLFSSVERESSACTRSVHYCFFSPPFQRRYLFIIPFVLAQSEYFISKEECREYNI